MDARRIFEEYAEERRSLLVEGFDREEAPHLVRYVARSEGMEGFVLFADLPPGEEEELIRREIGRFARAGQGFEWKVYDFDRPSDLRRRLEAEGFVAGTGEVFLVRPVAGRPPAARAESATLRAVRIRSDDGVRDVVAVQRAVWGPDHSWLEAQLRASLLDEAREFALFCAYDGDRPVGTGWLRCPPGSRFADIHGGAVLPEARGRGIYSLLLSARVRVAEELGAMYLAVDAAPMSRPILLRLGFEPVCGTVPMRFRSPRAG